MLSHYRSCFSRSLKSHFSQYADPHINLLLAAGFLLDVVETILVNCGAPDLCLLDKFHICEILIVIYFSAFFEMSAMTFEGRLALFLSRLFFEFSRIVFQTVKGLKKASSKGWVKWVKLLVRDIKDMSFCEHQRKLSAVWKFVPSTFEKDCNATVRTQ